MNFDIGDCPMSFQKQKIFCFENIFSYMAYCMLRESMRTWYRDHEEYHLIHVM